MTASPSELLNWLEPEGLYRRRRDLSRKKPRYISPEEVAALAVPAPRVPPRCIERKLNGFASLPIVVLMIMLTGVACTVVLLVLLGWGVFGSPAPGALPMSLITATAISGCAYILLRRWRANDRLLRRGTLVTGRISEVSRTGWQRAVGRQRRHGRVVPTEVQDHYKVKVSCGEGTPAAPATLSLWGQDGEIAERYNKDEARITLLVDPEDPRHVLWLEVLRGMPA